MHLRLDLDARRPGEGLESVHVDLVVKVADVGHNRLILHPPQVIDRDDVLVAGRRDEDVRLIQDGLDRRDLETIHRRLQRVDRVDLAHDHARTLATERLGRPLTDIAVAGHERDLAADQHIGRAVQAVDKRVTDAVLVIKLRLRHRVVHIDRREQQPTSRRELIEPVDTGGGFFRDAMDVRSNSRPAVSAGGKRCRQHSQDHLPLLAV